MLACLASLCMVAACYAAPVTASEQGDRVPSTLLAVQPKAAINSIRFDVHPKIIGLFSRWVSDTTETSLHADFLITLDANALKLHYDVPFFEGVGVGEWVEWRYGEDNRYRFRYKLLGQLSNGYYVLLTSWDGGGTGRFGCLYVMELADDPFDDDVQRALRMVHRRGLGDRLWGKITVQNNAIRLGRTTERFEEVVIRINDSGMLEEVNPQSDKDN